MVRRLKGQRSKDLIGCLGKDLFEKLKASTGKVMIKLVTDKILKKASAKLTAKTATKIAAKIAAKSGAKSAGKAAVKTVPFVGAVVGLGFGIWRLTKGDVAGAGMEVTSGAASCVPGGGTAASLGVDAAIVARDVYLATEEIKRLAKVIFEKRQLSLLTWKLKTHVLERLSLECRKQFAFTLVFALLHLVISLLNRFSRA